MKPNQTIKSINWNEQCKIRPRRNASRKHETIKLLIVLNIMEKYKRNLYWIRIFTEHKVGEKITDVYFENIKTKEIICYEVQGNITEKWKRETIKSYKEYENMFFDTDWILVREHDLPDDIETLDKEIKKIIA